MADKQLTRAVDQGIEQAEKALGSFPTQVKKRIIELKAGPREVISRIKQINGVIIEFEERG